MVQVQFDLGEVPSALRALADPALSGRAARAMAESYNDAIHDWIDQGRGFTPRQAGGLEQHINWRPITGGGEVRANKPYAAFVEEGTGVHIGRSPWVIRPRPGRKGLKIPAGGGYVIRRQVTHPGARPHPFFFADLEDRVARMLAAARRVIAQAVA